MLGQSGPGSNGNEEVLRIPQSPSIAGTSPSDLVSYPRHSLWGGGLTPLQRCSQCILQPQPTGQKNSTVSKWQFSSIVYVCLYVYICKQVSTMKYIEKDLKKEKKGIELRFRTHADREQVCLLAFPEEFGQFHLADILEVTWIRELGYQKRNWPQWQPVRGQGEDGEV